MNAKKQALLHCTRFSVTLTSSKLLSLGNERKKASSFALHCTRFSVTLTSSKLLKKKKKNKYIYFVLHSTFRNFVTATVGWESKMAILLTNMTHITDQYDSYYRAI